MSGEGSVYKRVRTRPDGTKYTRWIAQMSVGTRDGRAYERKVYATEKAAKDALKEMRDDQQAGIRPSELALGAYLRSWIDETARHDISPNTLRGYRAVLAHLEPIADVALRDLTVEDIEHVLNRMTARRHGQKVATPASPKTIRNAQLMLRSALDHAAKRGHVRRNEAKLMPLRRVPRRRKDAMTPELAHQVLEAIAGDRYEAGYALGFMGLRESEVLGLAWEDLLPLEAGVAHIRYQLVGSGPTGARGPLKTEASEAPVPLPAFVISRLRAHRARQLEERMAAGESSEEADGLVFVTTDGWPVNASWYSKHFQALIAAAGLPHVGLHELRHGAATLLAGQGVHPRIAQELLRHTTSRTTLDVYTHVTAAQQREAADVMDRVVAG